NITGANAGQVGTMAFAGIENLTGGAGDDTFAFQPVSGPIAGSLSGQIDGGGGVNKLDYSALTTGINVYLSADTAALVGTGGFKIRNVTGSQGDDLLRGNDSGNDSDNVLNGGGGNDILIGLGGNDHLVATGSGRNILVGGNGTDTLDGGSGDD